MAEQMIRLSAAREIIEAEREIYEQWATYGPVEWPKFSSKVIYRLLADQCADILAKIEAAAEAPPMHDLKAAAKRLRDTAARQKAEMEVWNSPNAASTDCRARLQQAASDQALAAQALEAWAWMAEKELCVERFDETWRCFDVLDANYWKYRADTPLGAVLAAMEGERDGE